MALPRVLVVADVKNWAWDRKAQAYQRHLSDRFDVTVAYHAEVPSFEAFDLVHLFEVVQLSLVDGVGDLVKGDCPRVVAGLTAVVWRTWGADRMRAWASMADALHGNSHFLTEELRQFHSRVFYLPNGVDPDAFRRVRPRHRRGNGVIFGHVGKPNPRKGAAALIWAAQAAGVELRVIQRTARLALSQAQMLEWYQDIDVEVTASNMDGTPNPMLEAAACECALLSTPVGNMPDFIRPGVNGHLTRAELPYSPPLAAVHTSSPRSADLRVAEEATDDAALRDELAGWMGWFRDHAKETEAMGRVARETVLAGWTWAQQVEHVAAMWREVLA